MTRKGIVVAVMVLSLVLGGYSLSIATPMLRLSDGNDVILIDDGSALDSSLAEGVVTYIGAIGVWTINVSTGLTKPALGDASMPFLDISSANLSAGSGTIDIQFSEIGFLFAGESIFAIGGTLGAGGSLTAAAYSDGSNTPFGTSNLLGSLGPFVSTGSFGGQVFGGVPGNLGAPYSLTLDVNLTHTRAALTSYDASLQVPEPASMLLLGLGLLGIGIVTRRKE